MISKGKIAALSAVGVAVILIAGGYGVSVAKFSPSLDMAETQIADFINQEFKLSERQAVSLEFHETPDSGLFSRKLNLVVADPHNNIQIPIDASIGFLNYKLVADLPNTTLNGQKLFDLYRADLDALTKLDFSATAHLVSGKSEFIFAAAGLNDPQNARLLLESGDDRNAFMEDAAAFAKNRGFGDHGTIDVRVKFDRDLNIETTGSMHEVLTPEFAVQDLKFSASSKGFGQNIIELGKANISFENLYAASLFTVYHVQDGNIVTEATPFDHEGNFDLKFGMETNYVNDDVQHMNLALGISGLNYPGLVDLSERMAFSSTAAVQYLQTYPFTLELYPETKLTYRDKQLGKNIDILTQGKMESDKANNKISGDVSIFIGEDINQLTDLATFSQFFVVEDNTSKSEIKFDLPFYGEPKILINGKEDFSEWH